MNSDHVIPRAAKSLLKSGKLSVKQKPKGAFHELYQDYVCSATMRVAREALALLPVQTVVVDAKGNLLE